MMQVKLSLSKIVAVFPLFIIILLPPILFAQTNNTSNTITGLTESSGFTYNNFISGNFKAQYEGRWAEDEDDHDMYEYLRFKTKDFFNNKVTIAWFRKVIRRP